MATHAQPVTFLKISVNSFEGEEAELQKEAVGLEITSFHLQREQ